MVDKDKPKVAYSASALAKEVGQAEPFVFVTSDNKRVTFPDPYEMDADDGEDKLFRWQTGAVRPGQILREWLSPADVKALDAEKFTVRQRAILLEKAITYYEQQAGSLGEGAGSAN